MNQHWRVYRDKINAMRPRERVLLLISAMAVVYLLWDSVLLTPALTKKNQLNGELSALRQRVDSLRREERVLRKALTSDPDAGQKLEIESLQERLRALSAEISALSVGLVPVVELPQILRDLLGRSEGLTLLGMETLPVEELRLYGGREDGNGNPLRGGDEPQSREVVFTGVFKHTVVVFLNGGYFQVRNYLAALEELPWRFYWERMNYAVENYPSGTIELRVYTLSSEEGLLGV